MQYRRIVALALALAVVAPSALGQDASKPSAPDVERLRAHVTHLASEKLEGRRTGTPGAEAAARYIADEFRRLGLSPGVPSRPPAAGPGHTTVLSPATYFQQFPYVAGVGLGAGNALTLTRRVVAGVEGPPMAVDLRVGEDWMPLGFSSAGKVEDAPAVFVGFGVTAAEQGYDDYRGADVAGKVAFALAGTADGDNPHGRFARSGELRFKAAAARAAGAAALVLIASDENFKEERLARLRYDNAGGDAGLPVAVISRQAAAKALGLGAPAALADFEKRTREWKSSADAGRQEARPPAAGGGAPLRDVRVRLAVEVVRKSAPASNVVGLLEGSDPKLRGEVIVVGAHYDHLGRGGEGSLAGREGEVHHGADDNASGTAGLLELARLFSSERERMRRTVVFVAFGGEEEGLIGSSFYALSPARPLEQTVAMLNMDMIGRLRDGALSVGGVGTAAEWRPIIEELNRGYDVKLDSSLTNRPAEAGAQAGGKPESNDAAKDATKGAAKGEGGARVGAPIVVTGANGRAAVTATPAERFALRLSEDGFGPSDHSSFYARRVPVLFFFTGVHEDYHKPSDTADRVNYEGQARVVQLVREVVHRVQAADKRPTYAAAKSEAGARSTTFRVSLGTVPSYGDSGEGLKLDAVRAGSPAEAAGLKAGDVVVKLAGRDVRNVYDYTQALSEMEPGREYGVEVLRDGARLSLKITPAARRQ